jgi:hypothetical protein
MPVRGQPIPDTTHRGTLYVAADTRTEIWDPTSGTRIGVLGGFTPTAQNPHTGALAEINNGVLRTWTPDR